jgi:PAS domain S-box-containing protein
LLGLAVPAEEKEKKADFFRQFIHPADHAAVDEAVTKALEETGIYEMAEYRIVRNDGTLRWMTGYGRVVEKNGDTALRMVGVMYDITNRVEATNSLRDKQVKLEIAQRAARVGIWGYDLVKNEGIATPELIELTGYPYPGETWQLDVFITLVHPDDRASLEAAHQKAVTGYSNIELEFRMKNRTGGWQWMLMRGSYIPPYDDNVNATLLGSLIDITERKAFEEQKDEFISIASHELKTPVTSIKVYTEILQERLKQVNDGANSEITGKLNAQVNRLTDLIGDLLDTTRIAEGRLPLNPEAFDLTRLIKERIEEMQHISRTHRIVFTPASDILVTADRERIGQVLTNLISNALKYSPYESEVLITLEEADNVVKVGVKDYGIGIAEEQKAQIFDRFFRVNNPRMETYPGMGLGLYISAGIIHHHNGTISVQSRLGEGALFCFTLPL